MFDQRAFLNLFNRFSLMIHEVKVLLCAMKKLHSSVMEESELYKPKPDKFLPIQQHVWSSKMNEIRNKCVAAVLHLQRVIRVQRKAGSWNKASATTQSPRWDLGNSLYWCSVTHQEPRPGFISKKPRIPGSDTATGSIEQAACWKEQVTCRCLPTQRF